MRVVVPDASVLLKWVLPPAREDSANQALMIRDAAIRGDIVLKVPTLWIYEIGNTLTRQFRRQAADLIQAICQFGLAESAWTDSWLDRCISLSCSYRVTFYDASYHSLAIEEQGVFVTADNQYVRRAAAAGSVISLKDWG